MVINRRYTTWLLALIVVFAGSSQLFAADNGTGAAPRKIRIACVGNSITMGVGVNNRSAHSYPARLQVLLGDGYEVMNFGASGTTVMKTELAYTGSEQYRQALQSNPDVVFVKLGTNDSRMPFRSLIADRFLADYRALIDTFRQLPSRPRVVALLPVTSYLADPDSQTDSVIAGEIIPRIRQVAYDEKLEMIDLHALTQDRKELFPDLLHPNEEGMAWIARRLYDDITLKTDSGFDLVREAKITGKPFSFHGYDGVQFTFEGREARVVSPRRVAAGKPWIWRARFWGHEPQTDLALLDRGFHLVYCDASELFGNRQAIGIWNRFYRLLTRAGLSDKTVMEGMSRGGVYVYNWAAENPRKVACVYADAPVLDLRSWPGGKGKGKGSPDDWAIFKADYRVKSEAAAMRVKCSPLDRVERIVKGSYPMLHVVGDADDVVPVAENTALFEQLVKAAGGHIEVIHKPGVGHHPHSLANPDPIVGFILKAVHKQE